jgi:DNA helicase II / ATP-dependent DNA helicase PcrA
MPQPISISNEEIYWAEHVLLPKNCCFDAEARDFIKSLDVIDLQAVPGSGKTTALLAKLLIIGKKLPFDDNSGVLVLSHTNAAVDEIKNRLYPHCTKLFSYPNFVGTIQHFVDEFLAIPCGHNVFKTRITRIDQEFYEDKLWRSFKNINECTEISKYLWAKNISRAETESKTSKKNKSTICNELIQAQIKSLYYDFFDNTIKSWPRKDIFLKDSTNNKFIALKELIENVIRSGVISFQYAYHVGLYYLMKFPDVKRLLQLRFPYVFIDEMQDMDEVQCEILESIFREKVDCVKYQRVGDKNQSIYNVVQPGITWQDRCRIFPLNGSQRLTKPTATVVCSFAISKGEKYNLTGLRDGSLLPHILVYDDTTIQEVIPFFASKVSEYRKSGLLKDFDIYPTKAIAWNTEWKNEKDAADNTKVRLVDYFPAFKRDNLKPKLEYGALEDYLLCFDFKKRSLAPLRKNILNALLKVLRLEDVADLNRRNYTKRSLIEKLKIDDLQNKTASCEDLKAKLYNWSLRIVKGEIEMVSLEIKKYVPEFLSFFEKKMDQSKDFLMASAASKTSEEVFEEKRFRNNYCFEDFTIEINTVHSAKGQTHCATLYLESYYDKFYEIDLLNGAFLDENVHNMICDIQSKMECLKKELMVLKGGRGSGAKEKLLKSYQNKVDQISERAKMIYVGFSRPTNFLCFAIHKKRFEKYFQEIDTNKWNICEVQKQVTKVEASSEMAYS